MRSFLNLGDRAFHVHSGTKRRFFHRMYERHENKDGLRLK